MEQDFSGGRRGAISSTKLGTALELPAGDLGSEKEFAHGQRPGVEVDICSDRHHEPRSGAAYKNRTSAKISTSVECRCIYTFPALRERRSDTRCWCTGSSNAVRPVRTPRDQCPRSSCYPSLAETSRVGDHPNGLSLWATTVVDTAIFPRPLPPVLHGNNRPAPDRAPPFSILIGAARAVHASPRVSATPPPTGRH